MFRKNIFVVLVWVLGASFLITGCGSNTPEDVATEFVKAISHADIKKAKELSTDRVHDELDSLSIKCNQQIINQYYDETIKVYNILEHKGSNAFSQKIQETMQKAIIDKYGSLEKVKEAGKGKSKDEIMQMLQPFMQNFFESFMAESKIKTEHPKLVAKILADAIPYGLGQKHKSVRSYMLFGMDSRNMALVKSVKEYVKKHPKPITPECIAKYTNFGFIDKVNFIETKKNAADRADVRLEIIHGNGKSKKISVEVESIQKEWKVSGLN